MISVGIMGVSTFFKRWSYKSSKNYMATFVWEGVFFVCFCFFMVTFTLHLNVKNLQSPGNLYITWENKKWVKNLI